MSSQTGNGRSLDAIDRQFKSHRKKALVKKYLIRILIILALLLFIAFSYTLWVVSNVSARLASHLGREEAKKVLVEREEKLEPITFLLLGSDTRGEERGRADTIIVARLCPVEKRLVLVSIPRDYQVEIPGYGTRKINAAYALGGARLMIETVSQYLGIEINHYAVIDFQGFKNVVDALGGVTINVEKRMYEKGHSNINLYPGVQRLNGDQALAYVRFRHDREGDFGRIRRQQQFLKALQDELLKASSIPKYPRIASIIAENVETDLSVSDFLYLARFYSGLGKVEFQAIMLPGTPQTINGASYVVPDEAKVKIIMNNIINECSIPDATEMLDPANVTVRVFNGTGRAGLARAGSNYLKDFGFRVLGAADADNFDYLKTIIIYLPGRENEARLVKEMLGFGEPVEAQGRYLDMLKGAYTGVILGSDAEEVDEIKERLPR